MLLSLNWLNQYLNVKLTAEEAEDILTRVGLEVEGVEAFESLKGGLKGVVTGLVVEKEKHPDADRLSVTKVDTGTGELLQIVCGAPNVAAGQKVIVATVGAVLYPGGEKLEIKKSKIRGVESQGMICAEDEIGTGASHDGILVLPPDTPVGLPAAGLFDVENDSVLEVNITPNRSDAASHIGCARDVAAYLRLSRPDVELVRPPADDFQTDDTSTPVEVVIENTRDCPRYSGLVVSGIEVKDSPAWLQNRLKAIGLNPINNVVDVTNYVLHELGHPLHAFDLAGITGNKIVIRNVSEGTSFVTLDDEKRKLASSDLMICNSDSPMCIAGVFGGKESGVSATTKAVFIESAYFNPVAIRKTSRFHNLHTDASFRFERGTDPNITLLALKRAAMLIKEVAGGKISSEIIDVYPEKITGTTIRFDLDKLNRIAGQEIPEEKTLSVLSSLDIEVTGRNGRELTIHIPTYKVDVTRDVDVIEEIMRIYGYDEIVIHSSLKAAFGAIKPDTNRRYKDEIAALLTANGFYEILTNSLSNSVYLEKMKSWNMDEVVRVENPISSELDVMRNTMLFSGLDVVRHNINHKNTDVRIFETGKVYAKKAGTYKTFRDQYQEQQVLAFWMSGNTGDERWYREDEKTGFFDIKGVVTAVLDKLRVPYKNAEPADDQPEFSTAFVIYGYRNKNTPLVRFGMVSPAVAKITDIKQEVWYAEVDWDLVLQSVPDKAAVYAEIPRFPWVRRDLALLVDKNVAYQSLKDVAVKTEKNILKEVNLFDVYEGKNIPENKKSYAISFRFQDAGKTLTDKEIDKVMEKLVKNFSEQLGAEIRS